MGAEIIALRCPSCGYAENAVKQELRFGYEFTCARCGTVSMLILNHQLYMPRPGEIICMQCGRVAARGARFCQCSAPLVTRCVNPDCLREFPVHHAICDYCGWPQEVAPSSPGAVGIKIERAILRLFDPDKSVRDDALGTLRRIEGAAPSVVAAMIEALKQGPDRRWARACWVLAQLEDPAAVVEAAPALLRALAAHDEKARRYAHRALVGAGEAAAPALGDALKHSQDPDPDLHLAICNVLADLGAAAAPAVPALIQALLYAPRPDVQEAAARALRKVGPPAAPSTPALIQVLTEQRGPGVRQAVCDALVGIGTPAVAGLIDLLARRAPDEVLTTVCEALGRIGDAAAVGPLIAAGRRTPAGPVGAAAQDALARIGRAAVPALAKLARPLSRDRKWARAALAKINR
ncbi:MAG: HEAT repeat domain-containing protein [Anaerolineae bacterium]|nr:HEAT repeat domain-containing protein [Anaerolineae bacterium]